MAMIFARRRTSVRCGSDDTIRNTMSIETEEHSQPRFGGRTSVGSLTKEVFRQVLAVVRAEVGHRSIAVRALREETSVVHDPAPSDAGS